MTPTEKHSDLLVHALEPFNAGPPAQLLCQSPITPRDLFFVRNHGDIPEVEPTTYHFSLGGMVRQPLALSLDDLKRYPRHTLVATLQCAGNRRNELAEIAPVPGELIWEADAISTGEWAGVLLRDLLLEAGIEAGAAHVAFRGLDETERLGQRFCFGGSIPLDKALDGEVLLAYEMNGEPLLPAHGFPLRVLSPGYIGARSVKWLSEINVQAEPSDNYFQAHAYKLFPSHVTGQNVDWSRGIMLGELPVNAVICAPCEGETLAAGRLSVRGYALTSGGRQIERVDLSTDGGATWIETELLEENGPWAWRFWQAEVELPAGERQFVARAWDSSANTQPESARHVWNFKGYMNNAWHRVTIQVEEPVAAEASGSGV